MATIAQRITPFLWYDTQAEEAANFVSLFLRTQKSWAWFDTETLGQARWDRS